MPVTVQPVTCHRQVGGWLAVSPPGAKFRIGTMGADEQEASERFRETWRRWTESVDGGAAGTQQPFILPYVNTFGVSDT
jgi:hypothetical protein